MATKKQLAALAKARAARQRRCRFTRKRTGTEVEGTPTKIKTAIVKASKSVWTALKSFTSYLTRTGIDVVKNTSFVAINTIKGQSARLTYIKLLLEQLTKELDNIEGKPSEEKYKKLTKNVNVLVALTELEMDDNKELPKRFIREIYNMKDYIKKLEGTT